MTSVSLVRWGVLLKDGQLATYAGTRVRNGNAPRLYGTEGAAKGQWGKVKGARIVRVRLEYEIPDPESEADQT